MDLVTKDMDKGDTTKISEKMVDLENTLVEDQVLLGDGFAATESIFERDKKKRHASEDSGFGGHEASSLAKKVKVDDENDDAKTIKNSDLDSKLDKILDILEDKKKIDKQCIKPFTTHSEFKVSPKFS